MIQRLEPHDGVIRQLTPQWNSVEGPSGITIPTCTFEGTVKNARPHSKFTSKLVNAAFPAFFAGEQYYRSADLWSGRLRRYSGADTLPRGCYSAVCRWNNSDKGGLVREIFAYTHPEETGLVLVDDMTDPRDADSINRRYGTTFPSDEYLLVFCFEPDKIAPRDPHEETTIDGELAKFFALACVTEHKYLDKVIDLRFPQVQEWFHEIFSDEDWLNIGLPLPPTQNFLEFLPFLVGQRRGGNLITQAIGRELRRMGVNGLVYPSARCDAAVVVEDGHVVDWYGWNLVDYSTHGEHRREADLWNAMLMVEMPHALEDIEHGLKFFGVPLGHMRIKHASSGKRRHTWAVVGLESLNLQNWLERLKPQELAAFGLAADPELNATDEHALHEVEQRFRERYRQLKRERGDLGMDRGTIRRLLGRLAKGMMEAPFGGFPPGAEMWTHGDKVRSIVGAEAQNGRFEALACDLGVLARDVITRNNDIYYKFVDKETFEDFTTVWHDRPLSGGPG